MDTAYRRTIDKAEEVISQDDAVLDIGCGTGIVTLGIAPCVQRIIAYDISENMIHIAGEKAALQSIDNVEFYVGDGYDLPLEDGCFDVVLLCNILHFLKEPSVQLKEAHRYQSKESMTKCLIIRRSCYGRQSTIGLMASHDPDSSRDMAQAGGARRCPA